MLNRTYLINEGQSWLEIFAVLILSSQFHLGVLHLEVLGGVRSDVGPSLSQFGTNLVSANASTSLQIQVQLFVGESELSAVSASSQLQSTWGD